MLRVLAWLGVADRLVRVCVCDRCMAYYNTVYTTIYYIYYYIYYTDL
jgi:uncharacterized membrane protein